MSYQVEPLGNGTARLVASGNGAALEPGLGAELRELHHDAGVLLLRGFRPDIEAFSALVEASSSRITMDPTRPFHSDNAQLVDPGKNPVSLHCENANSPFRPDYIWFFCQQAPAAAGETTYCDGEQVWAAFVESTRELFRSRRIEYHRSYPEPMWKAYVAHLLELQELSAVGRSELDRALGSAPGLSYKLREDGWLDTVYGCSAVSRTLAGGREAFGNSIRGPYPGQTVTLDGAEPIPAEVLAEIDRVYDRLTEEIRWQDGDVAWIDNTRFLHGRRPFLDPRRRIFAALSFA